MFRNSARSIQVNPANIMFSSSLINIDFGKELSFFSILNIHNIHKGHVLNLPQNIQGFLTKLPANVAQLPFLIIRRHGADNTFKDCTVRREKVLGAITWLKHNNPYYADIEIDQEALQQLPVHGVPEHLPTLDDPHTDLEPLLQLEINNSTDQEETPQHKCDGYNLAVASL